MNKFAVYLCFCFLTVFDGITSMRMYGQSIDKGFTDFARLRSISPNAPTTSSLGRFGEYPVNLVYGLPNINIPLLEFSSGNIMQKLNLQYHAGGIKVRERASWVGLGWSLSSGGVITANINGYPDLHGYFENSNIIPTQQERINRLLRTPVPIDSLGKGISMASHIILGEINPMDDIFHTGPDYAPDVYNICADNLSGSFVFNSAREPVLIDATLPINVFDISKDVTTTYVSGLKITQRENIIGFNVIDKDGYTYVFGGTTLNAYYTEATTTWQDFRSDLQQSYISAWYLNKILSPDRMDSIEFIYEKDVDIQDIIPSFYTEYSRCGVNAYKTFQNIQTHTIKLSTIKFKNGKINLVRSSWKKGEDSKLDCIILSSYNANTNIYIPEKYINFEYDYFINKDNTTNLKLSRIKFNGSDNNMVQQYIFDYDPLQLPGKNSNDLDHWGYYNGANNPGTSEMYYSGELGLIPRTTTIIDGMSVTMGVGNREPNKNYTNACILNTIHYPTGGYSVLIFENHITGDNVLRGGLRIKQILSYDNDNSKVPVTNKEYEYSGGYLVGFEPTAFSYLRKYFKNCAACIQTDQDVNVYEVGVFNSSGRGIYQNQSTTAYKEVIEKMTDQKSNHWGKTLYKYPEQKDVTKSYGTNGFLNSFFIPYQSYASVRENASFIGFYDVNDNPVKETNYNYYNSSPYNVLAMGLVVERNNFYSEQILYPSFGCVLYPRNTNPNYFLTTYQIMQIKNQLTKTVEKNYTPKGIIVDTTKYYYSKSEHPFPVRIEKKNSDGSNITLINKYPSDYFTVSSLTYEQLHDLIHKHVLSAIINRSKLVNNLLTDCVITEYEGLYPKTIYAADLNDNISVPSYNNTSPAFFVIPFELTQYMKPKIHFTYLNGKLLTQQKELDIPNSYIWGYNNAYPIAETKNATTNECGYTGFENNESNSFPIPVNVNTEYVTNAFSGRKALKVSSGNGPGSIFSVGNNALNHSGYKASVWVKGGTDAFLHIQVNEDWALSKRMQNSNTPAGSWNLIEVELPYALYKNNITSTMKIKVYCGSSGTAYFDDLRFHPMDAQMTTYTYDPLIGVTSVSDINHKPTTYQYDTFGRLMLVSDFQGNILKKYNYNYMP